MSKYVAFSILLFGLYSATSYSQGILSGTVTDIKTKETIIGAIVSLDSNITLTVQSNVDGKYTIPNISVGVHQLTIKYIGYNSGRSTINIVSGENTFDLALESESQKIKEVTVKETRRRNTENAVVAEIRKQNSIVSGVSAAQIQKSQDRSAADVVKRIPGVTIQEGRFINIRGLSERYNNVFLNDAGAPSSEADKRAFSFDVIPSGMIERILIYKTPSAELPGDFAGGMVKIYTQAMPDKNSVTASYFSSFREGTEVNPFYSTAGSKTDLLGFDNGYRAIPNGVPAYISKNDSNISSTTRAFKNNWKINRGSPIPDQRVNFGFQRVVKKGTFQWGNTTALSYSHTQNSYLIQRADYDSTTQNTSQADTTSTRIVNIGAMENMAFRFGSHQLEVKVLFNQTGRETTTLRSDTFNGRDQRYYAQYYQARTTLLAQLAGSHKFKEERTIYSWNLSYDYSNRNEPDFKRIKYNLYPSDSIYKAQVANTVDPYNGGGRFFSSLTEHDFSFNHLIRQKIKARSYEFELSAGNYLEYKTRKFDARLLGYVIRPGSNAYTLTELPLGKIFDTANVGAANNFKIDETTSPSDAYQAQNLQVATFINFNFPIGDKLKIIAGLRHEYNKQSLQTVAGTDTVEPSITTHFFLPSINASVNLTKTMLIRAAYGQTVNRPEFREWAPFYFYDFEFSAGNYGSLYPTSFFPKGTTLKVAQIQNVDLRYEWYPAPGDLIHVGSFFKYFKDPIQQVITPTGGSDSKAFTYLNGDKAYTAGIELDLRKNLGFLTPNRSRSPAGNFTLVFNAAYIYSKLYLPHDTPFFQSLSPTTQLQGQSPYIINGGLYYQNDTIGIQASLLYNVTGPRIFAIGNAYYPNIGEMPKHSLDLSISYTWRKKFTVLFAIQDIINQRARLVLDVDRNGTFEDSPDSKDKVIRSYKTGRYYTIGLRVKF